MPNKSIEILLIEDDEIDRESIKRALRKHNINYPLHCAENGLEGLEILRGEKEGASLAQPYIVLLDINMPRMNGIEFLKELRKDDSIKNAIVFVLTTSSADEDKVSAYAQNVAGYFLKSKVGEGFSNLMQMLNFYEKNVEFPIGARNPKKVG